jgi:hypothetical protein
MDEKIVDILLDAIKDLKTDMIERMDRIENKIVTKEDCQTKRDNCVGTLEVQKSEISVKKIIAIGGVVTGTITTSAAAIVTILKIVYS